MTANPNVITDETLREIALVVGPDWQANRHEPRNPDEGLVTPALDDMASAPGATQAQYRVTYDRVGRHGGRSGRAPQPFTVWAIGSAGLAERIAQDARPYLGSSDVEVHVDLELMQGTIFAGFRNGGTFAIEQLAVVEGRDAR